MNPIASANHKEKSAESSSQQHQLAIERRRRKRARISAQVHLRVLNAPEPFEEVCTTVDVSRDGLLIAATRTGYWKGQQLSVTFPYSNAATAINQAQPAEIVRVTEHPGGKLAIAVHFHSARVQAKEERKGVGSGSAADGANAITPSAQAEPSVVLAVEPDARIADVMRSVLQQDGYTVLVVPTAQEALDVLRTTVPVAFLAEVEAESDGMSGHDLCVIVKRNERLQRVPVILLTRSARPADYTASHQLGAVVCMAKPFKPERLLHVVRLVARQSPNKSAYGVPRNMSSVDRSL
jgi:CheY-like chemotaxis protein